MRSDMASMGATNPYALAELVIGRRVDWPRVDSPRALVETALGMKWDKLIDPTSGSILFPGLVPAARGLRRLPASERKADRARRLDKHTEFKPSEAPARPSPMLQALLGRPSRVALERLRRVLDLSGGESQPDDGVRWTDQGGFVADRAEGGDPVQWGVGDCYYIASLDAVAWTLPGLIQFRPLVASPSEIGRLPPSDGIERGSIRLSPGYYHGPNAVTNADNVVEGGPLWEHARLTELLPVSPEGLLLYARSSDTGEVWPAVYEKAFAIWRTGANDDRPDYDAIAGGWCGEATRALVGRNWHLDWWWNPDHDADDIFQLMRGHTRGGRAIHPMTAWTYAKAEDFPEDGIARNYDRSGIVYNHCYALLGWVVREGAEYVVVRNPWGYQEATRSDRADGSAFGLPLNSNGLFALPIEVFRRYFEGFAAVYP